MSSGVTLDSNAADNDETGADQDEQNAGPEVVPLRFLNLECLIEVGLLVVTILLAVVGRWRHRSAVALLLRWWAWWSSISSMLRLAIAVALLLRWRWLLPLAALRWLVHLISSSSTTALEVFGRFAALRHRDLVKLVVWVVVNVSINASAQMTDARKC